MKPFNLNDFKAGKKVVTRDGREVKQLTVFDCNSQWPICGVVGEGMESWTLDGKEYCNDDKSNIDLFHHDEEITLKHEYFNTESTTTTIFVDGVKTNMYNIPVGTYKLVKVD